MNSLINVFTLLMILGGCAAGKTPVPKSETTGTVQKTSSVKDSITYLALGDSYTIGESVKQNERFPSQLVAGLKTKGVHIADPTIIAQTGWTTDELILAIKNAELKETFDLVTLLIGVNNQYRHYSKETYRKEFKELLKTAIDFAGKKKESVIVISIPDWGVTPYANGENRQQIATDIDNFNRIARDETENMAVKWVDITPVSRKAETETNLVAPDGLHPSAGMYKLWVDALIPVIKP